MPLSAIVKRQPALPRHSALAASIAVATLCVAVLYTQPVSACSTGNCQNLNGVLGVATSLSAGVASSISFLSEAGLVLNLTPSAPCLVTVTSITSVLQAPLPAGCQQLSFGLLGLSRGYTVLVVPATATFSAATLVTPSVSAAAAGLISTGAPAGCVTPVSGGYAAISGVVGGAAGLTIPLSANLLSAAGLITAVPCAIQSSVAASLGAAVNVMAQSQQTIAFGSQVALQLGAQTANTVTCTTSSAGTGAGAGAGALIGAGASLGAFVQFAMNSCSHTSTVSYTYTAAQLAAAGIVDASRLRLALFDSSCNCYRIPSSGGACNTGTRVVTQVVTQVNGQIPQCAVVEAPYALGAAVNIAAGAQARLSYTAGCAAQAATSAAASLQISAVTSVAAGVVPSGCTPLQIGSAVSGGVGAGIGYAVNAGSGVSSCAITTAQLSAAAIAQLQTAGNSVDCIQLNSAGQFVARLNLAASAYNSATQQINCALPAVQGAQYIFVAAQAAVSGLVQLSLGSAASVPANSQATFQWGAQVALQLSSGVANSVTCTTSSAGTGAGAGAAALIGAGASLGAFVQFAMNSCSHTSTVSYTYTAAQLAAAGIVDASRLRLALFDSSCNCYRIPSSGGACNTGTRVITQVITQTNGQIPQCAVVEAPYALGAAVNIAAGAQARIGYTAGCAVQAATSAAASLQVSAVTSVAAGVMPSGCTPLAIGSAASGAVGAGIGYAVNGGAGVSSCAITTARLSAAAVAQLQAAGGAVDCVRLNSAGQFVARLNLAASAYNSATQQISCALPAVQGATYVFVSAVAAAGGSGGSSTPCSGCATGPVQVALGTAVAVATNYNAQISWGSQVALQYASAAQNTITCTSTSVGQGLGAGAAALLTAGIPLGAFIQFQMNAATHNSVIIYEYTQLQLALAGIIDASRLRIALFDESCNCYRVPASGGSCNTSTRQVRQTCNQSNGRIPQCAVVYNTGSSAANADGSESSSPVDTQDGGAGSQTSAAAGTQVMLPVQLIAGALLGAGLLM